MSVWRVMGIETEYGVSVPGNPTANAMLISSQVVNAYAGFSTSRARRARWDFEEENPLRDARGFDLARESADPTQLTDEDLGLANVILTNGARLYVDHAHPEYSSPEVTNPRDAVLWDKAGERVMAHAARLAAEVPGTQPIQLHKNNTDGKGASYGTHENYLMRRETPFGEIVRHLTPFFVSRQVVTGSGRVGTGQDGRGTGFQLSQRADFFEVEVGLETTLKRPIINTRDEPHANAERYRRLHVIIGDANLAEVATYLKAGTTALVLAMVEDGWLEQVDLSVDRPVGALHAVSHDPSLGPVLRLRDGRRLTAVQLQMEYLEQARKYVEDRWGDDADDMTRDVLERWESVLTRLENDPMSLSRELDWVAKLEVLEGYRRRDRLDWDSFRLQHVDLQYSDVRERGLYNLLAAKGRFERVVTEAEVERAVSEPPEDTRAYFRGRCLAQYGDEVAAASWDSVIFDLPGRDSLQRVPTLEPLRGTRAHVGALLERSATAEDLVRAITGS
ncbi:depupylase/deamidase Dop [Vallicoccus soli]|uniref:Proteasome accessory factor PafA2 n=1 Tax=Vallicoccus soli TaxID=2339232 RepID=A0A3A3YPN0_9ACTN|nr:depupylase/deamidase Dop [Vallicoccus soli]RJK93180.1 proteasome accessory factor PafA2 [Vallicoccus soli]